MNPFESPIQELCNQILREALDPRAIAESALAKANSNAGRNVYLSLDRDWTLAEAAALPARFPTRDARPLLYSLPISLKDCFDLAGFSTSCGSQFYAGHNGLAKTDSRVAEKLRGQGAVLTGKTHMQQLAYGITGENADYAKFCTALESICRSLALAIVADGEGAQRVIEIEVRGAPSARDADKVARTIANSPLVKTALAGADPNWGRILAAAGRSGVAFDFERTDIRLAGIAVCRRGREHPFNERIAHRKMLAKHVPIVVDLHAGGGSARIWTCDFTGEYVDINASYRT